MSFQIQLISTKTNTSISENYSLKHLFTDDADVLQYIATSLFEDNFHNKEHSFNVYISTVAVTNERRKSDSLIFVSSTPNLMLTV